MVLEQGGQALRSDIFLLFWRKCLGTLHTTGLLKSELMCCALEIVYGLFFSFCEFQTLEKFRFVGLDNYQRVLLSGQYNFWQSLWFTVIFSLCAVLIINVSAFFIAYALTRRMPGRNLYRTVFFMPNLIGGIVLGYVWKMVLNYGVLIPLFGKDLSYSSTFGFFGLLAVLCWQQIGYMMIIYIAGLQAVPDSLIEAAKIDGATAWQTLRRVVVPMVMPSLTICLFLSITNSFKLYDQNLALTAGLPAVTDAAGITHKMTQMLALCISDTYGNSARSHGTAQAMAVVFFVIVAAISLVQLGITRRREVQQ